MLDGMSEGFQRCLRLYDLHPWVLTQPTSRGVAEYILRNAVELNTRYPDHTGCLGINGVLAGSGDAEPVRRALIDARANGEALLRERFERAQQEGVLPPTANCAALATYLCTVLHGMGVQAKVGFSREVLNGVEDQALSTWPSKASSA